MTTDTFPKGASAQVEIDGKTVSIAGIAKGSGMIAPDMATMLVYIFTDAQVEQSALQDMLGAQVIGRSTALPWTATPRPRTACFCAATGASGVDATGNALFAEALEV